MSINQTIGLAAASIAPTQTQNENPKSKALTKQYELQLIQGIGHAKNKKSNSDVVGVDLQQAEKHFAALAQKVIAKIEEVLGDKLPEGGLRELNPEDHTPEKTAQRIVDQTTGLFFAFAAQNPNLEGEELLDKFMTTIRGGIKQGYEDAVGILEGVGAFEIDGVKEGIEETMRLVDQKLKAFEDNFRNQILDVDKSSEQKNNDE